MLIITILLFFIVQFLLQTNFLANSLVFFLIGGFIGGPYNFVSTAAVIDIA